MQPLTVDTKPFQKPTESVVQAPDALKVDEVHLWVASPEQCQRPDLIETYSSWLDDQERVRYGRFRFPQHRLEYLAAHALLRSCLSRYGERQPWEWGFSTDPHGRPEIQMDQGVPPLRFNLSHTTGLVTCAVTRSADVGVDVEQVMRQGDLGAIAPSSFAPQELTELNRLEGMAWRDRFFDLWTLKEAYIKARGLGLSLPLQQFAFRFESDEVGPIEFDSDLESPPPEDWKFGLLNPTPHHRLAVAVRCPGPLRIQVGWAIPGVEFQAMQLPMVTSRGVA